MPEMQTITGYVNAATGQIVFDEEVEGEIVQRIAKADPETGHIYIMYSGEQRRVTADPADGKLKINVQAEPMVFFEITVPEFVVSGEAFEITVQAFSYGWDYQGGIPQPVTAYAENCSLFFNDDNYAVDPTTIAASEWADGKVKREIAVTTDMAGESTANLHVQSDADNEHTGFTTLTVFSEAPPVTFDVQASEWQLEPVDGETDWFNLTAIARQLGKMLLHYITRSS